MYDPNECFADQDSSLDPSESERLISRAYAIESYADELECDGFERRADELRAKARAIRALAHPRA